MYEFVVEFIIHKSHVLEQSYSKNETSVSLKATLLLDARVHP